MNFSFGWRQTSFEWIARARETKTKIQNHTYIFLISLFSFSFVFGVRSPSLRSGSAYESEFHWQWHRASLLFTHETTYLTVRIFVHSNVEFTHKTNEPMWHRTVVSVDNLALRRSTTKSNAKCTEPFECRRFSYNTSLTPWHRRMTGMSESAVVLFVQRNSNTCGLILSFQINIYTYRTWSSAFVFSYWINDFKSFAIEDSDRCHDTFMLVVKYLSIWFELFLFIRTQTFDLNFRWHSLGHFAANDIHLLHSY